MPAWEISSPWGRRVRCHSGFGPPAGMDPPPPSQIWTPLPIFPHEHRLNYNS